MAQKKSLLFYVYAFTILLVMCWSNHMLFTWVIPRLVIVVLSIFVPLAYMGLTKCDNRKSNVLLCLLWAAFIMYIVFTRRVFSLLSFARKFGEILCVFSVILLPIRKKRELLKFVSVGLSIIIAISLPPWILHLLGVPLPHSAPFLLEDGFHWVTNYHFFLAGDEFNVLKYPRFRGMFIEAGQVAPVCVFIYFANNRQLLLWQKITLITAIILSFSLAGIVSFILCLAFSTLLNPKNHFRILTTSLLFAAIVGVWLFFSNPNNQNYAFYNLVIERLMFDEEKGVAGNNRTSDYVEYRYQELMKSKTKYIGLGRELNSAYKTSDNWTNDSSGIKKFIIWNGIVGTALIFLFMIALLLYHKTYRSFVLWIGVIANFLVRDLLTSQMWVIITILGVFVLHHDYLEEKEQNIAINAIDS